MLKKDIIDNKYFFFFSDCIIVKGEKRSIICDLTRNKFQLIPNDLYSFIEWSNKKLGKQIIKKYIKYLPIVQEYLQFLEKHEFFFWGDKHDLNRFPLLKTEFNQAFLISNSIIEINLDKFEIYKKTISEIVKNGVKVFQIRFYNTVNYEQLIALFEIFSNSIVNHIELCFPFNQEITINQLETLLDENKRIKSIFIHNTPIEKIQILQKHVKCNISFTENEIKNSKDYITKKPVNFIINHEFFFESQEHNTYYNKKLCIDYDGDIKNSPEINKSFGKIENFNFENIANNIEFQKLWHVSKNKIEICKNCEFRYVCFDTREPKLTENGLYFMPEPCKHKQ